MPHTGSKAPVCQKPAYEPMSTQAFLITLRPPKLLICSSLAQGKPLILLIDEQRGISVDAKSRVTLVFHVDNVILA